MDEVRTDELAPWTNPFPREQYSIHRDHSDPHIEHMRQDLTAPSPNTKQAMNPPNLPDSYMIQRLDPISLSKPRGVVVAPCFLLPLFCCYK